MGHVSGDQRRSLHLWRNQGPQINFLHWSGGFFFFRPHPYQEEQMENRELAFSKQAILATKDWDTYQAILRKCLRVSEITTKIRKEPDKL
jgi:hypothetical protein